MRSSRSLPRSVHADASVPTSLYLPDGHLGPIPVLGSCRDERLVVRSLVGVTPRDARRSERSGGGEAVALVRMLGCCVRLSRARSDRCPRPRSTAAPQPATW